MDESSPHDNFYVLALYDFEGQDADQLSFRKGSVLQIVETEDTGWWAALDPTETKIGWIPEEFVQHISEEMYYTYAHVAKELAGGDLGSDTVSSISSPSTFGFSDPDDYGTEYASPDPNVSPLSSHAIHATPVSPEWQREDLDGVALAYERMANARRASRRLTMSSDVTAIVPPSPMTPVPQPSPDNVPFRQPSLAMTKRPVVVTTDISSHPHRSQTTPLMVNKPTPPTPRTGSTDVTFSPPDSMSRAHSETSNSARSEPRPRSSRTRPSPIVSKDTSFLRRISMALDGPVLASARHAPSASVGSPGPLSSIGRSFDGLSLDDEPPSGRRSRAEKVLHWTGDQDAQAFVNAKEAQASAPWYLRPSYIDGQDIKLENDGSVRCGTLHALVERLTIDPLKLSEETAYRRTFLLTFRSFTTADRLFDLLEERFRIDHPADLTEEEFQEWRTKKLRPTQTRVLTFLREWLEVHQLLQVDPQVAPRMRDFLSMIKSPPGPALTAKQTLQSLERLVGSVPKDVYERHRNSPTSARSKRHKSHSTDILKYDSTVVAQHLCLYEARLYMQVRPAECLAWARRSSPLPDPLGSDVSKLVAFCATNDKLASWVKMSVLDHNGLGKRADTIDQWIKVAEKCRALCNISSLSAIIAALSSVDISSLNLTWAHVGRLAQYKQLSTLMETSGGFSACRAALQKADGPCIPFIGMYLSDLVHYNDRFEDTVSSITSSPSSTISPRLAERTPASARGPNPFGGQPSTSLSQPTTPSRPLINFVKRQYIASVIDKIVRHQAVPYSITEEPNVMSFVEGRLTVAAGKDQGTFWVRSQEVQQAEVAHADIRRGLEQAGF